MSWQGLEGHDAIVEQFRRGLAAGRLGSTFLFVGPEGIGKRSFAIKLAQSLLCESQRPLEPCGHCSSCVQVAAGTHPDVDFVAKPEDKSAIPLELLIGVRPKFPDPSVFSDSEDPISIDRKQVEAWHSPVQ